MSDAPASAKALRITMLVFRTLMGLLFLWSSTAYFFDYIKVPPIPPGPLKLFDDGIRASRYLLPTVKGIEGFCALCFLSGRLVPFASVLVAPIIVNILLVAVFLAPIGLPFGIFLVIANGVVAFYHRDRYAPLFRA
ncbi:MAG: hypothetical protein U0P81_05315 [Holophagaceae bacterium]